MSQLSDRWVAASTYENFMGRWSRALAREYVQWLHPVSGLHWLELGCGTGALTAAIAEAADPASAVACDPAPAFTDYAREHSRDARVSFLVASAHDFPVRTGGYHIIVSLLALNFFQAPEAALDRMRLATTPAGLCSACVWDYSGEMQVLRYFWDAAREIDHRAQELDEGVRFPICTPDALIAAFNGAALTNVSCDPIEIVTEFASFDDYWMPFLGRTGPAPSFVLSLGEEKRDLLRTTVRSHLPVRSDGSIRLRARAWAVRGTAPST